MDGSLENYTIVERLGEGTSGKVLKGKVIINCKYRQEFTK